MNIHEYQAKAILAGFGVPVPKGVAVFSAEPGQRRSPVSITRIYSASASQRARM